MPLVQGCPRTSALQRLCRIDPLAVHQLTLQELARFWIRRDPLPVELPAFGGIDRLGTGIYHGIHSFALWHLQVTEAPFDRRLISASIEISAGDLFCQQPHEHHFLSHAPCDIVSTLA